jgi:predicted lactoylglutathione lyase
MPRKLFVNIGVEDLDRSVAFFTGLGFEFDPRFTDETATCMLVGEDAYFMLLTREKLDAFRTKPYADPETSSQALFAISAESREAVDDPDGHHWEVFWMDMAAAEEAATAGAAQAG